MPYTRLTRNDPADIARCVRRVIHCRYSPCGCGCLGADSQHKASYKRVVRDITVHADPICTHGGHVLEDGTVCLLPEYEVARGFARLPGRGLATVRCVVRGTSIFADWHLVTGS